MVVWELSGGGCCMGVVIMVAVMLCRLCCGRCEVCDGCCDVVVVLW